MSELASRKRVVNDKPYPSWWVVDYTWSWKGTELIRGDHEFQVGGSREWFTFDRYVRNTRSGKDWVDGFAQEPYGAFVSFYPSRITKVRARSSERKLRNASTRV